MLQCLSSSKNTFLFFQGESKRAFNHAKRPRDSHAQKLVLVRTMWFQTYHIHAWLLRDCSCLHKIFVMLLDEFHNCSLYENNDLQPVEQTTQEKLTRGCPSQVIQKAICGNCTNILLTIGDILRKLFKKLSVENILIFCWQVAILLSVWSEILAIPAHIPKGHHYKV